MNMTLCESDAVEGETKMLQLLQLEEQVIENQASENKKHVNKISLTVTDTG